VVDGEVVGGEPALDRRRPQRLGLPPRAWYTPAKTGRTLAPTPHDPLLRQARAGWAEDRTLRQDYRGTWPARPTSTKWLHPGPPPARPGTRTTR
jgi:hypothetical protein